MPHSTRPRCSHAGTAGFTLIEVLVALAVVAASLAAIGSLAATNARGVRAIEQQLSVTEVARVIVSNLPGREALTAGTQSGVIAGHRWRLDVTPFVSDVVPTHSSVTRRALPWMPLSVAVTVQGPGGRALRVETIRLARRGRE